ncbi:MAG: glycosyltransferase family 2 protein [Bacteroidia bacterium]|nr:glycosyltransferase family 2 protein [Bacteroidia bacterium]
MKLSIVVPVYKAEFSLHELVSRIISSKPMDFNHLEIILVEDGSPDNSWQIIEELSQNYNEIIGLKLSRNFGQHHAITAGLDIVDGDWIVVMDCDLQDQPEEIDKLYQKTKQGYSMVLAKRLNRRDSFLKKFQSALFYKVYEYISGVKQDKSIANFGIYHRNCIVEFNKMREPMRAFPPMMQWIGYKKSSIEVEHAQRKEGKSTYTLSKLIRLALDIAIAYSDKPLRMSIKFGFYISFLSFLFGLYQLYQYSIGEIKVPGYTSIIVSIWFLSGVILFFLGITGLYIGRSFDGIKNRQLYIIDNKIYGKRKG